MTSRAALVLAAAVMTSQAADARTTGLVVVEVRKASSAEKAGMKPGDFLLSWERPTSPDTAEGELKSVFDWTWIERELGPRGPVRICGERGDVSIGFDLQMGKWGAEVRPVLSEDAFKVYAEGKAAIASGQIDRGIGLWRGLLSNLEISADPLATVWMDLEIGNALAGASTWGDAIIAYQSALKEAQIAEDVRAEGSAWDAIGEAWEEQSDPDRALVAYESAEAVQEEAWGDCLVVAERLSYMGQLECASRGNLDAAEQLCKRAIEIQEKLAPGSLPLASSLSRLGMACLDRGALDEAEAYCRRALAIQQELVPNSRSLAVTLNRLGTAYATRGNLVAAEISFRRMLAVFEKLAPDGIEVAAAMANLGALSEQRGDLEAAESNFRRALAVMEKLDPGSRNMVAVLNNLGAVTRDRGDLAGAGAFYKRGLALEQKRAPGSQMQSILLRNLGEVARLTGDLAAAGSYYSRALDIRRKLGTDSLDVAASLNDLGEISRMRGHLKTAETLYRRACSLREKLAPRSVHHAETLHALAVLFRQTGRRALASDYFSLSLGALEAQKGMLGGSEMTKSAFAAKYIHYYKDYIAHLVDLGRGADAFDVLERSRARGLLALLAERDLLFEDLPRDLAREQKRVDTDYDQTQTKIGDLDPKKDSARVDVLLNKLRDLRGRRDEIAEEVKKRSPRAAALQYPQPLGLQQIRVALDPGTALLSYCVDTKATLLFVVAAPMGPASRPAVERGGVSVLTLPIGEQALREQVGAFRKLIEQAERGMVDVAALTAAGRVLYDELVRPAEALISSSERLLLCPDGPLHGLPFGALVRETSVAAGSDAKYPSRSPTAYLIEWKPLHTIASATVWVELKEVRPVPSTGRWNLELAAFGDPTYPSVPMKDSGEMFDPDAELWRTRGYALRPLPATRLEVQRIASAFPGKALTYVGPEATEERAKTAGRGVRYIHFACHGILDARSPLDSALALAIPDHPPIGADNGLLQAWEILERVRVDADLVTLSACKSALGMEVSGEGLIGLTRAFQCAGARSVVASLWDVSDETTAELMSRFYRYLAGGKPKDESLRAAQIDLITSPARFTAHPFYWAAFELIGDWR